MLRGFVGIAILVSVSPCRATAPRDTPASARRSSRPRDRRRRRPPAGEVSARPLERAENRQPTLTDANGRYEVTGLSAGRYTIMCWKPNRARRWSAAPLGPGLPIDVANGQVLHGLTSRCCEPAL
jgi:hypothetical protein